MRAKLQQDWIRWAQMYPDMDDIIFDEGDILGEDYKVLQVALSKQAQDPASRSFQQASQIMG